MNHVQLRTWMLACEHSKAPYGGARYISTLYTNIIGITLQLNLSIKRLLFFIFVVLLGNGLKVASYIEEQKRNG